MAGVVIRFVSLCLVAYFVYEIVLAWMKLQDKTFGTTVTQRLAKTIPYPAITFCPFNNSRDIHIQDGDDNATLSLNRSLFVERIDFTYMNGTFAREDKFAKDDLKHTNGNATAFHHVALQPKFPNDTYIRECVTLRPPATTKLGDEHEQVHIEMDVTNANGVYVFHYNQKQMYVPNKGGIFRSTYRKIILPAKEDAPGETQYIQYLRLGRIHWKTLDHQAQRCSSKIKNPDVAGCIARYIERSVGCTLPIHSANVNTSLCQNNILIHKFLKINRDIASLDEGGIYKLTGCLSSCRKDEFHITEASEIATVQENMEIEDSKPFFGNGNPFSLKDIIKVKKTLHLYLYYVNGLYDEKEQYIIYDMSSFIADVGGYMGLLLGSSLQGMAEMVERWLIKIGRKIK